MTLRFGGSAMTASSHSSNGIATPALMYCCQADGRIAPGLRRVTTTWQFGPMASANRFAISSSASEANSWPNQMRRRVSSSISSIIRFQNFLSGMPSAVHPHRRPMKLEDGEALVHGLAGVEHAVAAELVAAVARRHLQRRRPGLRDADVEQPGSLGERGDVGHG